MNDKIYVIGGESAGFGVSTVEEYDPISDTWLRKANMPTPRFGLTTCTINGKIYAIGGGLQWDSIFSTVEQFDPITNKWVSLPNMPSKRMGLSSCVINGKIYVIGGTMPGIVPSSLVEVLDIGPQQETELKGRVIETWGRIKSWQ